jgi:hypothetical protein
MENLNVSIFDKEIKIYPELVQVNKRAEALLIRKYLIFTLSYP